MASVETLAALCAGSVNYQPGTGPSAPAAGQLSRAELASLMSGMRREEVLYAMAKYCDDGISLRQLIAHVQVHAAGLAIDQGWRIVKGKPIVSNMARMAVIEVVAPNRCSKCNGSGIARARSCVQCSGTGFKRLSGRRLADYIEVDERQWRARWCERYEQLVRYVQRIDSDVNISVRRNGRSDMQQTEIN